MYINFYDVYLLADSKSYPFHPVLNIEEQFRLEQIKFESNQYKDDYILNLAKSTLLDQRWEFYDQNDLVKINTLLFAIDTRYSENIKLLKEAIIQQNKQFSAQNQQKIQQIEQILLNYTEILYKLPGLSRLYEIRINYEIFVRKIHSFVNIYYYSDNQLLILKTTLMYFEFFYQYESKLNEMLDEYQVFLYDLQNAYLTQRPSRKTLLDILSDHKNYPKKQHNSNNNLKDEINLKITDNFTIFIENFSQKYNITEHSSYHIAKQIYNEYGPKNDQNYNKSQNEMKNQEKKEESDVQYLEKLGFAEILIEIQFVRNIKHQKERVYFALTSYQYQNLLQSKGVINLKRRQDYSVSDYQNQRKFTQFSLTQDPLLLQMHFMQDYPVIREILAYSGTLKQEFWYLTDNFLKNKDKINEKQYIEFFLNELKSRNHDFRDLVSSKEQEQNNTKSPKYYTDLINLVYCSFVDSVETQKDVQEKILELQDEQRDYGDKIESVEDEEEEQEIEENEQNSFENHKILLGDNEKEIYTYSKKIKLIADTQQEFTELNQQVQDSIQLILEVNFQWLLDLDLSKTQAEINQNLDKLPLIKLLEPINQIFFILYSGQKSQFSDFLFKILSQLIQLYLKTDLPIFSHVSRPLYEKIILRTLSNLFQNIKTDYVIDLIQKLVTPEFLHQILDLMKNKGERKAHFIFNQVFYNCIELSVPELIQLLQNPLKKNTLPLLFVEIYELLDQENMIIYLRNFEILQKIVSILDEEPLSTQILSQQEKDQKQRIISLYAKIWAKNFILWGSQGGFKDHIEITKKHASQIEQEVFSLLEQLQKHFKTQENFLKKHFLSKECKAKNEDSNQYYAISFFFNLAKNYMLSIENAISYLKYIFVDLENKYFQLTRARLTQIINFILQASSPLLYIGENSNNPVCFSYKEIQSLLQIQEFCEYKFGNEDVKLEQILMEILQKHCENLPEVVSQYVNLFDKTSFLEKNFSIRYLQPNKLDSYREMLTNSDFSEQNFEVLQKLEQFQLISWFTIIFYMYNSAKKDSNIEKQLKDSATSLQESSHSLFKFAHKYQKSFILNILSKKPQEILTQFKEYPHSLKKNFFNLEKQLEFNQSLTEQNKSFYFNHRFQFQIPRILKLLQENYLEIHQNQQEKQEKQEKQEENAEFVQNLQQKDTDFKLDLIYNEMNIIEEKPLENSTNFSKIAEHIISELVDIAYILEGIERGRIMHDSLKFQNLFFSFTLKNTQKKGLLTDIITPKLTKILQIKYKNQENNQEQQEIELWKQPKQPLSQNPNPTSTSLSLLPFQQTCIYNFALKILNHFREETIINMFENLFINQQNQQNTEQIIDIIQNIYTLQQYIYGSSTHGYELISQHIPEAYTQVSNKYYKTHKEQLLDLGIKIINIFLYTVYEIRIGIRSCCLNQVINQFIKIYLDYPNEEAEYLEKSWDVKKLFQYYIAQYLERNFQYFQPDFEIKNFIDIHITTLYHKAKIYSEQNFSQFLNKLQHFSPKKEQHSTIQVACIQTMIINQFAILIQDTTDENPNIDLGIEKIFAYDTKHWPLLFAYMKTINIIIQHMGSKSLTDYEKQIIEQEPFTSQQNLLQEMIKPEKYKNQEKITQNTWNELFSIVSSQLIDYISAQKQQIYDIKKSEQDILCISYFQSLLDFCTISFFQSPSTEKQDILQQILSDLSDMPIQYSNRKNFMTYLYPSLKKLVLAFNYEIKPKYKLWNGLLHLVSGFYDSFEYCYQKCLPLSIIKHEETLQKHIQNDPTLYAHLFTTFLTFNQDQETYSLNLPKINEFYNQNQAKTPPKYLKFLADLYIKEFCENVTYYFFNTFDLAKSINESNYLQFPFSYRLCIDFLIEICMRYPAMIKYILQKPIEKQWFLASESAKFSNQKDKINEKSFIFRLLFGEKQPKNMNFQNILMAIHPYVHNSVSKFFRFLVSSENNYEFQFQLLNKEITPYQVSSSIALKKEFIEQISEKLRDNIIGKCPEQLQKLSVIHELQADLRLLNSLLFCGIYSCIELNSLNKLEDNYLKLQKQMRQELKMTQKQQKSNQKRTKKRKIKRQQANKSSESQNFSDSQASYSEYEEEHDDDQQQQQSEDFHDDEEYDSDDYDSDMEMDDQDHFQNALPKIYLIQKLDIFSTILSLLFDIMKTFSQLETEKSENFGFIIIQQCQLMELLALIYKEIVSIQFQLKTNIFFENFLKRSIFYYLNKQLINLNPEEFPSKTPEEIENTFKNYLQSHLSNNQEQNTLNQLQNQLKTSQNPQENGQNTDEEEQKQQQQQQEFNLENKELIQKVFQDTYLSQTQNNETITNFCQESLNLQHDNLQFGKQTYQYSYNTLIHNLQQSNLIKIDLFPQKQQTEMDKEKEKDNIQALSKRIEEYDKRHEIDPDDLDTYQPTHLSLYTQTFNIPHKKPAKAFKFSTFQKLLKQIQQKTSKNTKKTTIKKKKVQPENILLSNSDSNSNSASDHSCSLQDLSDIFNTKQEIQPEKEKETEEELEQQKQQELTINDLSNIQGENNINNTFTTTNNENLETCKTVNENNENNENQEMNIHSISNIQVSEPRQLQIMDNSKLDELFEMYNIDPNDSKNEIREEKRQKWNQIEAENQKIMEQLRNISTDDIQNEEQPQQQQQLQQQQNDTNVPILIDQVETNSENFKKHKKSHQQQQQQEAVLPVDQQDLEQEEQEQEDDWEEADYNEYEEEEQEESEGNSEDYEDIDSEEDEEEEEKKDQNIEVKDSDLICKSVFDFTELGFAANTISKYKIPVSLFKQQNTDEDRINLIIDYKDRYNSDDDFQDIDEQEEQIQETKAKNQFNFQQHGYSEDALDLYGIDKDYFYSLPLEIQLEILGQKSQNLEIMDENQLKDKEIKHQLNKKLQKLAVMHKRETLLIQHIFSEKTNDFFTDSSLKYEKKDLDDIELLIKDLDQEDQAKLLRSMSEDFLKLLSTEIQEQAQQLKDEVLSEHLSEKSIDSIFTILDTDNSDSEYSSDHQDQEDLSDSEQEQPQEEEEQKEQQQQENNNQDDNQDIKIIDQEQMQIEFEQQQQQQQDVLDVSFGQQNSSGEEWEDLSDGEQGKKKKEIRKMTQQNVNNGNSNGQQNNRLRYFRQREERNQQLSRHSFQRQTDININHPSEPQINENLKELKNKETSLELMNKEEEQEQNTSSPNSNSFQQELQETQQQQQDEDAEQEEENPDFQTDKEEEQEKEELEKELSFIEIKDIKSKLSDDLSFYTEIPFLNDENLQLIIDFFIFTTDLKSNQKNSYQSDKTTYPLRKLFFYASLNPFNAYRILDTLGFLLSLNKNTQQSSEITKILSTLTQKPQEKDQKITQKTEENAQKYLIQTDTYSLKDNLIKNTLCSQLQSLQNRSLLIFEHFSQKQLLLPFLLTSKFSLQQPMQVCQNNFQNLIHPLKQLQNTRNSLQNNPNLQQQLQQQQQFFSLVINHYDQYQEGLSSNDMETIYSLILNIFQAIVNNSQNPHQNQIQQPNQINLQEMLQETEEENPEYLDQVANEFSNNDLFDKFSQILQEKYQKTPKKVHYKNLKISNDIINNDFIKMFNKMLIRSESSIKSEDNISNLIFLLVKYNYQYFSKIFIGSIQEYSKQINQEFSKQFSALSKFKERKIKEYFTENYLLEDKNSYNPQKPFLDQLKNEEQKIKLIQDFYTEISATGFNFEIFHKMRHFIVDMDFIILNELQNKMLRYIFKPYVQQKQKKMRKLESKIEDLYDISVESGNDSEMIDKKVKLQKELDDLNKDFAKELKELKNYIIRSTVQGLKIVLYQQEDYLEMVQNVLSHLEQLTNFFGTSELDSEIGLDRTYENYQYAIKGFIILYSMLNPLRENEEQLKTTTNNNNNTTIDKNRDNSCFNESYQMDFDNLDSFNGIENQIKQLVESNKIKDDSDLEVPRLQSLPSKLIKRQSSFFINQQNEQQQQEQKKSPKSQKKISEEQEDSDDSSGKDGQMNRYRDLDLDELYEQLYTENTLQLISYFSNLKSNRIEHYNHFIRSTKNKQNLTLSMKLHFLRAISIREAKKKNPDIYDEQIYINIDRDQAWMNTLDHLKKLTAQDLVVKEIKIQFKEEDGIDYGGLKREWLSLLNKEIFNPELGLFQLTSDKSSIYPSPYSFLVPDHLLHYQYLGRLVGKCMIDNLSLDVSFSRPFIKHMLNKPFCLEDLKDIDQELYNNLKWTVDNSIDDLDLSLNFTHTLQLMDEQVEIPLIENGQNISVNESNKNSYIKSIYNIKISQLIEKQTLSFLKGLYEVVPKEALAMLNENELALHFNGMPTIDVQDLKDNTSYYGYSENCNMIKWFWQIMNEYDEVDKANFLFFLTGSYKVPYGGFKNCPMKIEKTYGSTDALPVAHTCFNQLDAPVYQTKEKFKQKLTIAIREGQTGFHIS